MRETWSRSACVTLSLVLAGCGEIRDVDPAGSEGAALASRCLVGEVCGDECCDRDEACVEGACVLRCDPPCPVGWTCGDLGVCVSACLPNCAHRVCGPDGCGGTCGECPAGSNCLAWKGQCSPLTICVPRCQGRVCGSDGCEGTCGDCPKSLVCLEPAGACVSCIPDCHGRDCGFDGCEGSCGVCAEDMTCSVKGECVACVPNCQDRECGDDGCGGHCGRCPIGQRCEEGRCTCPATVVNLRYSTDLAPLEPGCTPSRPAEASCDVAIHEWCADRACANTGFGPVYQRGNFLEAVCLEGQLHKVSLGALSTFGCSSRNLTSSTCTMAFHWWCREHGHVSGFGPTSLGSFLVGVSCVDHARALKVPRLMMDDLGCASPTGPACRFAANRLCRALGYLAGYGPVDVAKEGLVVTCLPPEGGGPQPCGEGLSCPSDLACCLGVCAPRGACGL